MVLRNQGKRDISPVLGKLHIWKLSPSTGEIPQCWGNLLVKKWLFCKYFGIDSLNQFKINYFMFPHGAWIHMIYYSILAYLLHILNWCKKISISPVLGNSPSSKKFHFPSTGEISQYWVFPDWTTCFPKAKPIWIYKWGKV